MEWAIAVFDVGKTNKKLLVYDPSLNLVDSAFGSFPTEVHEGIEVEPLEAIEAWLLERLSEFAQRYPLRVISVATHGACSVGIGGDGEPSMPVVSYTHEPASNLHDQFYRRVGSPAQLQRETSTIEIRPLVNVAKAVFFQQKSLPEQFSRTRSILMYPQYFGYRLTGEIAAEPTYVGCHTYLWDFESGEWSHVVDDLGIRSMLPGRLNKPHDVLGTVEPRLAERVGLDKRTIVTVGIHDSNASLLPYLIQMGHEDLTLNSTGTWCVAMHPTETALLDESDIGKSVFYNLSVFGTPVKTSILLGGLEYESYSELLAAMHGTKEQPPFDASLYNDVLSRAEEFVLPSVVQGTGQFPHSEPRVIDRGTEYPFEQIKSGESVPPLFEDHARAFAVLNVSLAIQSRIALERVGTAADGTIYIEGGFRNNTDYVSLLAALFPYASLARTDMQEATAFGAALLGKAAYDGCRLESLGSLFAIHTEPVERPMLEGLDRYVERYTAHLEHD